MKMTSFKTLIFCAFILLIYLSKGSGIQCWKCHTRTEGDGACDDPQKTEGTPDAWYHSTVCVSLKYSLKDDPSRKEYFYQNVYHAPSYLHPSNDTCATHPAYLPSKDIIVDHCQVCYQDLCNLRIRGLSGTELQCWDCDSGAHGDEDCDHPTKSKIMAADWNNRPVCLSANYSLKNDESDSSRKQYYYRTIFRAPREMEFPADDCANHVFSKFEMNPNVGVRIDTCQVCYKDLCNQVRYKDLYNLAVRGQSGILVIIAGMFISWSFHKIRHL
ncbi:uncharacterized protein LOC135841945 [Planococcus citri]|uniref:uncharacterized protein LOC135841945 n=1 Tax=Planococcus citri TaxID=170843 RepID=UPI0031F8146B